MNWVRECSVDSLQCSGICVLSCHAERSDSVVKHLLILRQAQDDVGVEFEVERFLDFGRNDSFIGELRG